VCGFLFANLAKSSCGRSPQKEKKMTKKKATEIWVGGRFELQKAREFLPSPFWLLFFRSLFLSARAR
jgi:hypothetical protein